MSDAPAHSPFAAPIDNGITPDSPWLLEVKASKRGLVVWLLGMTLIVLPFMTAMAVAIIGIMVLALVTPQPNAVPGWHIGAAVLLCLIGPPVVAALWMFVRCTIGIWRCLRNGRPAVRADERGLEMLNVFKWRWDRMPWEDVGALAHPSMHTLVVEHIDPKAWRARQSLWKRFGARQSHRQMGVYPAMGFGMPMEEPTDEVIVKIAALRDAKHLGLNVAAADAVKDVAALTARREP
ncbi:MAG: hypothetical protein QM783_15410 [Phycisphaerales bacterium]